MITLVLTLLSKIGDLLLKKTPDSSKSIDAEHTSLDTSTTETNQINREEIKRGFGGRNFVFYVAGSILLWNYVICPVLDLFGYTMFQLPLGEIFKLLAILITG